MKILFTRPGRLHAFHIIGFLMPGMFFCLGLLAYRTLDAGVINHAMVALVLMFNLFCLLLIHYQHIHFISEKPYFDQKYAIVLDHQMLDELRALPPLEFRAIVQYYQEITPKLLTNLNKAISGRDAPEILRVARRLHSAGLQIGARQFAALTDKIILSARSSQMKKLPRLETAALKAYGELNSELKNTLAVLSHNYW